MEFFGLTLDGAREPIKKSLRDDFNEPTVAITVRDIIEKGESSKRTFADLVKDLDVYLGPCDGFSYRSFDRLLKMRKRGLMKPVGPLDMHKYPLTESMKLGWFREDPDLVGKNWYETLVNTCQ